MFRTNGIKSKLLLGAASVALFGATAGVENEVLAQDYTTGTLSGVVQDESGAIVAGATVTVSSNRGVNRTIVSAADGGFRLPQLPIGPYTVSVSKAGYADLPDQTVSVNIGQSAAYTFTLDNMAAGVEEVYVVGTRQGSWDFNTTTTGLTVNVGELFEKTPIARNSTAIALLAPGTGAGDTAFAGGGYSATGQQAVFSGSSVGENVYYINGLNITNFRDTIGGSTVPFELYEQFEVKTGGYQAEFGRSTGGVINAVTKSGSNELHFGANVFWSPDALREDVPDTVFAANRMAMSNQLEYNIWASGAIIQDKLFFYGLYNPRNNRTMGCSQTRCTTTTRDEPFYAAKIDFVPFDGHRLEYTYFSDRQDRDDEAFDFDDATSTIGNSLGTSRFQNGGSNHIFKYTAALTDNFTISGMYGENSYDRSRVLDDSSRDVPSILEYRGAFSADSTGDWVIGSVLGSFDKREAARIDADLYFDLAGEHHIRMGWDQEKLDARESTRYSGNLALRYYDSSSSSTGERVRVRQYFNVGNFATSQSALYIQDSWQVLDNLMLNIGLRNETFENLNAAGEVFVENKNQIALRTGFSWDPTEDGMTRVYGSWGRYFLPIATNTNIRMAGSEQYVQQYFELPTGWDQNTPYITADSLTSAIPYAASVDAGILQGLSTADGAALVANTGISTYANGQVKDTASTTDYNLKPMYQDEWIIGAEHMLDDGWTIGIRYVHRNLGRMIEDIAIDSAVPSWAAANGYTDDEIAEIESIWSGFHQYVLTNPGGNVVVGATDLPGSEGEVVVMTLTPEMFTKPYPKGSRTYDAVDLTFSREFDGVWSLDGSYTWSRSYGNYEGSVKSDNGQTDAGLTTDFDQPGFTDGAEGFLPNDRRHRIKVWGSYALTDQMTLGALFNVEAPRKFGCLGEHPTDLFAWYYGAASWFCGGESTPRGSKFESDWTKTLDLSLSINPDLSDQMPGQLTLRVDVFNVLNSHAARDFWEFGDLGFTSDLAFGGTTAPTADPDYGEPTGYQAPRRVRFSASYTF